MIVDYSRRDLTCSLCGVLATGKTWPELRELIDEHLKICPGHLYVPFSIIAEKRVAVET